MHFPNPQDTVIIYHGKCRDGFSAAYAAWKIFGDEATYIPARDREVPPEAADGKHVYILDYSYPAETLHGLKDRVASLTVIDHHESAKEAVTQFEENVFDMEHSGAVLAWQYFHPGTEVPRLLQYVEDHDLWQFNLPKTRAIGAALGEFDVTFERWDELVAKVETEEGFDELVELGTTIARFEDRLVQNILSYAEKVEFEGMECYAVNASRVYRSILGNELARKNADEGREPIGIVYYHSNGSVHASMRSYGDTRVNTIAEKYGGGGHKNAASFRVPTFADLPFQFVNES